MDYPKNAPLFRILQPWKNFDRAGVFFWIFIFAMVVVVISLASEMGRTLFWTGGLIILVYALVFLASAWERM